MSEGPFYCSLYWPQNLSQSDLTPTNAHKHFAESSTHILSGLRWRSELSEDLEDSVDFAVSMEKRGTLVSAHQLSRPDQLEV